MTENEAIEIMKYRIAIITDIAGKGVDGKAFEDMEMAINALKEIQPYRAIGTVEEIESYVRLAEKLNLCDLVRENARLAKKIQFLEVYEKQLAEYESIGTIEECREAREKQMPKKPVKYGYTRQGLDNDGNSISWQEDCYERPTCGSFLGYVSDCKDEEFQGGYCQNCGQSIGLV